MRQILNKNTSPYFHSVSLVIWPLTLMKRTHFSELFTSRFSTYIRKGLFSLIFFLLATTHLGTWTGEGCTSSRGPRYKAAMKDRTKYLLRAISSRDSNSDREYTTPKHPKLLIPGYDAEVEEIDSALEARRWNKVKRSLTLLRKNLYQILKSSSWEGHLPKNPKLQRMGEHRDRWRFSIRYLPYFFIYKPSDFSVFDTKVWEIFSQETWFGL